MIDKRLQDYAEEFAQKVLECPVLGWREISLWWPLKYMRDHTDNESDRKLYNECYEAVYDICERQ